MIVQVKLYIPFARQMLSRYLYRPYEDFISENSSEMLRDLTSDLRRFFNGYIMAGLVFISEFLIVAAILTGLILVDPVLTLVAGGILGLSAVVLMRAMQRRLVMYGRASQAASGAMIRWVTQALNSAKESKVLGTQGYFLDNFRRASSNFAAVAQRTGVFTQLPRAVLETLVAFTMVLAVLVASSNEATAAETIPTLVFLGAGVIRMTPSILRFVSAANRMQSSKASAEVVLKALAISVESEEELDVAPMPLATAIEAKNLTFAYGGNGQPVLSDLNFTIPVGTSAAFVGRTGAGKTTLIDLLLGLLEPTSGDIYADGTSISKNRYAWRKNAAYVPQGVYLSDASVRENVVLGQKIEGDVDTAVWDALDAAQVGDFIRTLPDGLKTVVGEAGVRFSGGQRQRLVIARALISKANVIALDEATSALDNETENRLTRAIESLGGTRTVIVVAHRLSTIRKCDQIFVLEHGKIAAKGTYDELLETSPEFQRIAASNEFNPQRDDQPDDVAAPGHTARR